MTKATKAIPIAILLTLSGALQAQGGAPTGSTPPATAQTGAAVGAAGQEGDPRALVDEAVRIVDRIKEDPRAADMLGRVRGIFIVPRFDRRAALAGEHPTAGLMLARRDDGWTSPVFFDTGPISLGAHAGANIGAFAVLLLSEEAVERFSSGERFTISADQGFNIANHAVQGGPFPSEGDDVVLWSDAAGLFPGASVRVNEIRLDTGDNRSYYGRDGSAEEFMRAQAGDPRVSRLRAALPG